MLGLSSLFRKAETPKPEAAQLPIEQPWFSTPFFDGLLANSNLSESDKALCEHFARYGYAIIDLDIPDIDDFAEDLRENIDYPIREGKPWNRVQDAWRENASVRELACLPDILSALEILYRRKPIPFQTLNFPVGTEQATHSDTIHFNSIPERWMCGVWVALEDIDDDNGPLHYYPGSHKMPIYHMHDFGLSPQDYTDLGQSYPKYERAVARMIAASGFERKTLSVKKGQALIWEANLFHGGSPIKDHSRTRYTQVTHYYFEGCSYYGPLQSDMPLGKVVWRQVENIKNGEIVTHHYNGKPVDAPMFDGSAKMLLMR